MGVVTATGHLLAGDSWIALPAGVKFVRNLCCGDAIVVLLPDGKLGSARVNSVTRESSNADCVSLPTSVGEIMLPEGSRIITRNGIQSVEQVATTARTGQPVRVEVIRPGDLFVEEQSAGSTKSAYRAAIAAFPRRHIIIPAWLDESSWVGRQVEEVLSTAEVSYRRHDTDDWCAFRFIPPVIPETTESWARPGDQARVLRLLTAWSVQGQELVSRVLFAEASLLQRLTGTLAAAAQEYEVKWVPGYRPVEIHVLLRPSVLRSHVPVTRIGRRIQDLFRISIDRPGSLVVGLALVT